jgi:hypothetical protein
MRTSKPIESSRRCERCGERKRIGETLATPFVQYWCCSACGEVWATARKRSDLTADEATSKPISPVRRFLFDTKTIASGVVLAVAGVLYVLRRKSRPSRRDMN